MMRALVGAAVVFFSVTAALAQETDSRFDSNDPAKTPLSVPLSGLEERINNDPAADGVKMTIRRGRARAASGHHFDAGHNDDGSGRASHFHHRAPGQARVR